MNRRSYLGFLAVVAALVAVFGVVGSWFGVRIGARLKRSVQVEQTVLAESVARNVESYVARVSDTVRSVLRLPNLWEGDPKRLVAERYRILTGIYPEIRTAAFVEPDGEIYSTDRSGTFQPMGVHLDDLAEADALREILGRPAGRRSFWVTVSSLFRYVPELDGVTSAPVLLFVQQVRFDGLPAGVVLVPYEIDFLLEHFVRAAGLGAGRDIHFVTQDGLAVYSSVPAWLYRRVPRFVARSGTGAGAFTGEFSVPGDGRALLGAVAPVVMGDALWGVAVTTPLEAVFQTEREVLLPVVVGAAVLVVLLCALVYLFFRRIHAYLRQITVFKAAAEQSGSGITIYDAHGRFVFANRAFGQIMGVEPPDLVGRGLDALQVRFVDRERLEEVQRHLGSGQPWQGELQLDNPDRDGAVFMHSNLTPIREDGRVIGFVGAQRDITDSVRQQQELERYAARLREKTDELEQAKRRLEQDIEARKRAEQEKAGLERKLRRSQTLEAVGQLAGGVAHDFNNLLGSILGCVYVLQLAAPGESPAQDDLQRIRELCKRGGDLTRQLLSVARKGRSRVGPVNLAGVLRSVHLLLRRTVPQGVQVVFDVPDDLPEVRGNPSNLMTAFLNLGLNARDAMPGGGVLRVEARADGGRSVRVTVSDTGTGIPRAIQDRVFEPFFTTKDPGKGTGLGLSSVYTAVQEGGGEISLASSVGEGTVFTVTLPAAEPRPGTAAREGRDHPLTPGEVLVVEDEDPIARMISGVLADHGYRVARVATGIEALERIRDRGDDIGLVCLDLLLPGVGGIDLYRLLQGVAPDLPVLFVTGREDLVGQLDRDLPHLPKPFTAEDLLRAVETVL